MRLSSLMPQLMNTMSLRRPCKAACLIQSGGQRAVLRGHARLWEAWLDCLTGLLAGVAKPSWKHTPSFSHPHHCGPAPCAPVPSAFIASQGPALSEPGCWPPAWDTALILPDTIPLGLGKSCPRVPRACVLSLLPLLSSEVSCLSSAGGWGRLLGNQREGDT